MINTTWIGSPNFTSGRENTTIDHIVIHWMDGTLASTDAVFQDTTRQTSAHYGIEDGTIHQYVQESDTAWHAGNWAMNLRSIGIEHSAQPGRDASAATLENSAQLIAQIAKEYNIPLDRQHVLKHSEVPYATQCCGTINVDALVARANQINGSSTSNVSAPIATPTPTASGTVALPGTVTVGSEAANIRTVPTTQNNSPIKTNPAGTVISVTGYTHGELVNGSDIWWHTWNGYWISATTLASSPLASGDGFPKTVTVDVPLLYVRSSPSTSAVLAGDKTLTNGEQVVVVAQATGTNVSGNNTWYQAQTGNWIWSGGVK